MTDSSDPIHRGSRAAVGRTCPLSCSGGVGAVGLLFTQRNPYQVRFAERLFARAADDGFGVVLGPVTEDRRNGAAIGRLLMPGDSAVGLSASTTRATTGPVRFASFEYRGHGDLSC